MQNREWAGTGMRDYRGIIHCHSNLSHDSWGSLDKIRRAANARGIDFVVITDHWSSRLLERSYRGPYGNTLFIPGVEISQGGKMSLIAFPLPEHFVPENVFKQNISTLEEKGSLVFASHIEKASDEELSLFKNIETVNLHAYAMKDGKFQAVVDYFHALLLGGDMKFMFGKIDGADKWKQLEKTRQTIVPMIVGSDVHESWILLLLFGADVYGRNFELMTTHVLAPSLTEPNVVEALRAGHSYVAFEILGSPEEFRFFARDNDKIWLPGDTLQFKNGQVFVLNAPKTFYGVITLYRDNEEVLKTRARHMEIPISKKGIYHVEIVKNDKLWILSNSILVR